MKAKGFILLLIVIVLVVTIVPTVFAAPRDPTGLKGPHKSAFYDLKDLTSEFVNGVGNIGKLQCTVSAMTQPSVYAGNMLLDCDGEVPHNETTIVVDQDNASHAVGGYHSYQIVVTNGQSHAHIVGTTSVTFDGGTTWQEVVPRITGYQFTGDPALTFDSDGRIYFANLADNEGQGFGNYNGPDIIVAYSDDGGLTYTDPITVAQGKGAVDRRGNGTLVFNDKEFIAADRFASSPFANRVYITWTKFQEKFSSGVAPFLVRSPIMLSYSDDGIHWSKGKEISGFSPNCVATISGQPNECDLNQASYPTVASNGKVYMSFENFNTPAENQVMVVSSSNGGANWSAPVKVDTVFDVNFPVSPYTGRATMTGCEFRYIAVANSAADPSDPTGNTVYVVWADNRAGTDTATDTNVYLGRSTDGGATWTVYTVDSTANDQFYPWVAVAPGGRVDVGYMDRSYSSGQNVCQYGFTLARATFDAGGMMTVTHTRVDTGLSDPGHSRWFSGATGAQGTFIGDYNGIAVGPDGMTWSLWTDQRNIVAAPPSPSRNHGQHAVGAITP